MRKALAALTATVLLLLPALATGAIADTGPSGPTLAGSIEVTSARLLAKGVAVDLGLDVYCTDESGDWVTEYGFVTIDERVGRTVTRGYGDLGYGMTFTCDGVTANHVDFTVRADPYAFKQGLILVSAQICLANLDNYQDYGCLVDAVEYRLRK
jgi:hypothetical protein